MRELNRRTQINLVYDPEKKFIDQSKQKKIADKVDKDLEKLKNPALHAKNDSNQSQGVKIVEPALGKAQSVGLPFGHLSGKAGGPSAAITALGADPTSQPVQNEPSQIFKRRHKLFSEIKMIPIEIQHCKNLWVIEEYLLRNVRNLEDVRKFAIFRRPAQHLVRRENPFGRVAGAGAGALAGARGIPAGTSVHRFEP